MVRLTNPYVRLVRQAFKMTYIDPVTGENRTVAHSESCGRVGRDPVWVHVDVM